MAKLLLGDFAIEIADTGEESILKVQFVLQNCFFNIRVELEWLYIVKWFNHEQLIAPFVIFVDIGVYLTGLLKTIFRLASLHVQLI